jgi:hypothetical protein
MLLWLTFASFPTLRKLGRCQFPVKNTKGVGKAKGLRRHSTNLCDATARVAVSMARWSWALRFSLHNARGSRPAESVRADREVKDGLGKLWRESAGRRGQGSTSRQREPASPRPCADSALAVLPRLRAEPKALMAGVSAARVAIRPARGPCLVSGCRSSQRRVSGHRPSRRQRGHRGDRRGRAPGSA